MGKFLRLVDGKLISFEETGGGGGSGNLTEANRSIASTDGSTAELNCNVPTVVNSKMRLQLSYSITSTQFIEVYIDQKKIPLYVDDNTTPGPYYKKISQSLLEFDRNYTTDTPRKLIEVVLFGTVAEVPVPSLLAGLDLKGRAYVKSDGSSPLYGATSVAVVSGKTQVTLDFDLLQDDVLFIEKNGLYS